MTCNSCDAILGPDVCILRGRIYRNGEWRGLITFRDEDGDPVDVSGWDFRAQLKRHPDDSTAVADFIFSDGPATNQQFIEIDEAVRRAIPCGRRETDSDSQYVADFLGRPTSLDQFRILFRTNFSIVFGVTDDTEPPIP